MAQALVARHERARQNTVRTEPKYKTIRDLQAGYWKSRRLASGSYGKVYLLRQRPGMEPRAAKYQRCRCRQDLDEVRKEVRILASLDHRNVLQFVDYFEDPLRVRRSDGRLVGGRTVLRH